VTLIVPSNVCRAVGFGLRPLIEETHFIAY
jgi:hypothetical protein